MTERAGRCRCGAVSFKLAAEPLASNGTVNLLVHADGLASSGPLSEYSFGPGLTNVSRCLHGLAL